MIPSRQIWLFSLDRCERQTTWVDIMIDDAYRVKKDMVACAKRAYDIGLQTGNGGNLSGRLAGTDRIIIKPSGFSFAECTTDNLITVNLAGEQVEGEGDPSRELRTHLAIYNARPDVLGIFHCHSPWAIACAEFDPEIPCVSLHAAAKVGSIPVLKVAGHADQTVKDAVEALLSKTPNLRAFVQARHGIFSLAGSITLAEHTAELVEETAQIAWLIASRRHT
jgi:L-fuculose-phosphate aldolase/L-ribulose-5-phosphate 4-epimerase